MTHCTSVIVAWRSAWSAGSATLTTVASMKVRLDPRMVATRVHRLRAGMGSLWTGTAVGSLTMSRRTSAERYDPVKGEEDKSEAEKCKREA